MSEAMGQTLGTRMKHYRVHLEYFEGRRPRRFLWAKKYASWMVTSPDLPGSFVLARSAEEAQDRFFEHVRFMTDWREGILAVGFEKSSVTVETTPR